MRDGSTYLLTALAFFIGCTAPSYADAYSDGNKQYAARNYEAARQLFTNFAVANPASWQAWYQLANTYVQLKDGGRAKMGYAQCLTNHPPADVKANCDRAVAYINAHPTLTAKEVASAEPKDDSDSLTPPSAEPAANPQLQARRERIIKEGEEEVIKMRTVLKEKQDEMEANSNQRYVTPEGVVKNILSPEQQALLDKEAETKAGVIRERAKKRAAELK